MTEYKVTVEEDTAENLIGGAARLARALSDGALSMTSKGILSGEGLPVKQQHFTEKCEHAYTWVVDNYDLISGAALLISETLTMIESWIANDEIHIVGNER